MADIQASSSDLRKGIKLTIGGKHAVTILTVRRVRLTGMFFDLNKCFLLPSAMKGIKRINAQYKQHPKANLLIVGHTDTSGDDDFNLALSLERADAVAAYLTDDTAPWEAFFQQDKSDKKRWGTREIQLMLSALPDGAAPEARFFQGNPSGQNDEATKAAIRQFQGSEGLKDDGIAGPVTRKSLIAKYMSIDGTSLPSGASLTTHGCGENFPASAIDDGVRSPEDRRVEIFFFDGPITPPPPDRTSKRGSTEYPQWLAQVAETVDLSSDFDAPDPEPFQYGIPVGGKSPWGNSANLRIVSDDGSDERVFAMSQGKAVGNYRFFIFPDSKPGLKYKGFMEQGDSKIQVFGAVELTRLADPSDKVNRLPLPESQPAASDLPADPPDAVTAAGPDTDVADPDAIANASQPEPPDRPGVAVV